MIVIDTNVVSEFLKSAPSPAVLQWLNNQPSETLFLSSVSVGELLFGIGLLKKGQRRAALEQAVEALIALYSPRVLMYNDSAARAYADLASQAQLAGRKLPIADAYIAAIAKSNGFLVATRDTGPFQAAGVGTVNPWVSS
jgi:toxin FitB